MLEELKKIGGRIGEWSHGDLLIVSNRETVDKDGAVADIAVVQPRNEKDIIS